MLFAYTFSPFAVPTLVTAAGMLILGAAVMLRERFSRISKIFFVLTLSVSVWLFAFSMMYCATLEQTALWWARFAYLGVAFIPTAVYHFSLALVRRDERVGRGIRLAWILSAIFLVIIVFTPFVITGVYRHWWGFYPRLGLASVSFLAFFVTLLFVSLREYIRAFRAPQSEQQKQRIAAFLLAFAVSYLGIFDYVPSFGYPLYPFGYVFVAAFLVLAAAAIWRYHLVDLTPEFAAGKILETMQGAVLVIDLEGEVRVANRAACSMLGYDHDKLIGLSMASLVETPFNLGKASDTLMRGQTIRDRAMVWRTRSGDAVEVGVSASMLRGDDQVPAGVVYIATDISDRRRAEQIEYQAYHDALTGLPNRTLFKNRLLRALENPVAGKTLAVMFLDLDGFKLINDTLGHSPGDELLQMVARRLKHSLREDDLVARLGGDEFTVLVWLRTPTDANLVGQKLLDAFRDPFHLDGGEYHLTTSIGIAIHPNHGRDVETLLKNADTAMYLAKELGKNNYQLCGPALNRKGSHRLRIENDLRRAIQNDEFVLHYQPVIDLRTRTVSSVEALIRWQHPTRGLLKPDEFMRVAEEARLIVPMGGWVLEAACSQLSVFQRNGAPDLRVAVNISAHQFQQRQLIRLVEDTLKKTKVTAESLILEVTETVAMQNADQTVAVLQDLKDIGVAVAIDDFGTGYSSLGYLTRFPLDAIKIDRSFIRALGLDTKDSLIVEAVVAMAHAMNLTVVAEGVEREEQLRFLEKIGCDSLQGYLFSEPLPASQLIQFVRSGDAQRHLA